MFAQRSVRGGEDGAVPALLEFSHSVSAPHLQAAWNKADMLLIAPGLVKGGVRHLPQIVLTSALLKTQAAALGSGSELWWRQAGFL